MRTSVLPYLRCPLCTEGPITTDRVGTARGERIVTGTLRCEACGGTTDVVDGIWHAMGARTWTKTLAQMSNVTPPTPQLYERLWRVRSLSLLSGRRFPNLEELGELGDALAPDPTKVFVDVACSEGLYARALAEAGATVIAIDHSVPFLKRLVRRSGDLPIVAVRALAQHLPIRTGSLDGAAMGGSLNEIGDQQAAVSEMGRVTRVGGSAFSMSLTTASTPFGRWIQRALRPAGISTPTVGETLELFDRAGLRVDTHRLDRIVLRVSATHAKTTGGNGAP